MALDPADSVRPPEEVPISPLAGTRSQSMQRLQIGLFGLAAMVLLVSLANIIKTNAAQNEARVVPEAAPTVAGDEAQAADSDPLADAGLVPDMPDEQAEAGNAAPALQP
jgi:hypothetical protein